jgi:hypothetical protein
MLNRLHKAILDGEVAAVRELVSSEPPLLETCRETGTPVLKLALQKGQATIVAALLRAGVMAPNHFDFKRLLCQVVSELSQELSCAQWLSDVEFILWLALSPQLLSRATDPFGFCRLDEATLEDLRFLEEQCQGWCHYGDDGPKVVTREEWSSLYAAWSASRSTESFDDSA